MLPRTLPVALLAGLALACAPKPTAIAYVDVASQVEQRDLRYAVYEPPGWDHTTPLPLVVFLHGGGDDETVWERKGMVTDRLDAWIDEGLLPPFVAVIPDGDMGFWANWYDGSHRYADWVMDEVIPDVRARLPLLPAPEGQHLMGISMGGAGTLYLGLDHLDQFASLNVLSAPIFDADQMLAFLGGNMMPAFAPFDRIFGPADPERVRAHSAFDRLTSAADLHGTRLFLAAGTTDMPGILKSTRAFHDHLTAEGVPHDFVVFHGAHVYRDWSRIFPVALCGALRGGACDLPADRFYTLTHVDAASEAPVATAR
ncbi:MAG: esterase family protein [Alphaproteobacteria bacterium]|nr:esterase family protein [Alphaproteobacteria bacterium]